MIWAKLILSSMALLLCGCAGEIQIHPYDAAVLKELSHLSLVSELDERGRVFDLKVEDQELSRDDLKQLCELTEMRWLSLYGSEFDEEGLQDLVNLGRLEGLGVGKTPITDKAWPWIAAAPGLRWLWIFECEKITKKGVAEFREQRADVEVYE